MDGLRGYDEWKTAEPDPEPCDECGHVRCVCEQREAEALTAEPRDWSEYRSATAHLFRGRE